MHIYGEGTDVVQHLQLREKEKFRQMGIWFGIACVVPGIISAGVYPYSCGIENKLPCENFYPVLAVSGEYGHFTSRGEQLQVQFSWGGGPVYINGTFSDYLGGHDCIATVAEEEDDRRIWEELFGTNVTILVHKRKEDVCMTLRTGAIRAEVTQFFGWLCILCIFISVYNVLRSVRIKSQIDGTGIQPPVTEVHAVDDNNDRGYVTSTIPSVVAQHVSGDSNNVIGGNVVVGTIVQDPRNAAIPVASSISTTAQSTNTDGCILRQTHVHTVHRSSY